MAGLGKQTRGTGIAKIQRQEFKKGGIDVEVTNPQETQEVPVGGQKEMLPEKKRRAKWY